MAYPPNDPVLHKIEELDKDINAAKEFPDLNRVCHKYLNNPIDQPTSQEAQLACEASWSTLKGLQNRLEGISEVKYKPQTDRLKRDLRIAFQEYNKITARYARQEHRQIFRPEEIYDIIDSGGTEESQLSALAVDLSHSSNALRNESTRNEQVKRAEWTLGQLAKMWNELDEMVTQQEPAVIEASQNVFVTQDHLGASNAELEKGTESARGRRKRKWWCLLIVVLVIITVVVVVVVHVELGSLGSK